MLANHGWLFVLVGIVIATVVSFAIPRAANRSETRQPR
jgi:hypothetical protein